MRKSLAVISVAFASVLGMAQSASAAEPGYSTQALSCPGEFFPITLESDGSQNYVRWGGGTYCSGTDPAPENNLEVVLYRVEEGTGDEIAIGRAFSSGTVTYTAVATGERFCSSTTSTTYVQESYATVNGVSVQARDENAVTLPCMFPAFR